MNYDRLGALTADQYERLAVGDAVRLLAIAATTDVGPTAAAAAFAERYPTAPTLKWLTAAAPGSTTDPANAGALLPPALLDPLVARMQRASILGRIPGLVSVPLNTPVPVETQVVSIVWTGQGAPKPVSQLALATILLGPTKGAGIVAISEELARLTGAGGEAVIGALLVDASTRFVDREFLDPARVAVAGLNPASITATGTLVPGTGTIAGDLAALVDQFYTQRPQAVAPVFVLSPRSAAKLAASAVPTPDLAVSGAGRLLGTPAIVTPGAGTAVVLLDAAAVYYHDGGAEVDTSRQAAIAGATPLDLWSQNLVGFRLDRFVSWAAEATAVAYCEVA